VAMSRVAVGARTTLLPGRPSVEAEVCGRLIDQFTLEGADLFNKSDADLAAQFEADNPQPPAPAKTAGPSELADYALAMEAWSDQLNAALQANNRQRMRDSYSQMHPLTDQVRRCLPVLRHRTGLMWDVAYATIGDIPGGDTSKFSDGGAISHTAWSTVAYVYSRGRLGDADHRTPFDLSLLGVVRYHHQDVRGAYLDADQVDYGARVVLARERWGFSVEGLARRDANLPLVDLPGVSCHCSLRAGGVVDYHLASGMWASLSGGTDFKELDGSTPFRLLAHFQANFGLDRLVIPDTTTTQPATTEGAP
jgi:hypothetical protein